MATFMKCPHCGEETIYVSKTDTHVNGFRVPHDKLPKPVESVSKQQLCPACRGWAQITSTYRVSLHTRRCEPLDSDKAVPEEEDQE